MDDLETGLSAFKISQSTGDLSMLAGFPMNVQLALPGVGYLEIAPDPSGKFLYLLTQDSSGATFAVSGYLIDPATGALTAIAGSPFSLSEDNSTNTYPATLIVSSKAQ